jgi:PAS domain S-box-containing protein
VTNKNSHIIQCAFDYSPGQIYIIDPLTMQIVDANETALQTLGYTKEELLQLAPGDIDASYTNEMMFATFDSIIKSKEKHATVATFHRRKDNSTFEVEVYLRSFNENCRTYILASATNTGVLKKAQEKLMFHSALFNNISDAIVATDENFCITSYNKYAEEVFGWKEEDAIGKSTIEVAAPIYPHLSFEEVTQQLFENGFWKGEIITHKKNGKAFPALISAGTLKDTTGKITGTVSVIKNISEQKKRDEQISYLADLVNKVNDAIISINEDFSIKSWNRGAEFIYGYTYEETANKNILALLTRDYPAELINEVLNVLETSGYWEGELKQYHKNNTEIWTLVSATTLKNEKGVLTGYVLVGKDITERKKLENQLKQFNEELEKQVQEKTAEIKQTLERISDAFVSLDKNSCYTYVNPKAEKLLSRPAHHLIGKPISSGIPATVDHPFYKAYREAVDTQRYRSCIAYDPFLQLWLESNIYPSSTGVSIYARDVTERKKAELALKESEEKYRSIVETAQEGIWQIDENNVTTFVNEYLAFLLGYTAKDMIGENALDFVPEENKERALINIEDRKKGISTQHELTFINRQRQQIHTLIQSTSLFKDGNYAGSISMLLDITQRKQAEEKLTANEKRFRALIENSSDGIILFSAEGVISYISSGGEKITGHKKEEMIGCSRLDSFHPDDQHQILQTISNIIKDPSSVEKLEVRYRLPNGSYKWLECNCRNLLEEPSVQSIIVNFRDITERKNVEKQLQKNKEELYLIYNSAVNPIWLLTVEGTNEFRYQAVNAAYAIIAGIEKDKVVGKLFGHIAPFNQVHLFYEKYNEAIKTCQIIKAVTSLQLLTGDKTVELTIVPIKNEEGEVVRILGTANDITEQRKAQDELIQMNNQLRELTSHLQNIREEERTHIAREIHDELGQQLTVLKMDIFWLNKKLKSEHDYIAKKIKGTLQMIDQTINTVRKIAAELRPGILDDLGLAEAIEWQCREFTKRTDIPAAFSSNVHEAKFPPDISIGLFRILQESLTNVARHAHAAKVICRLQKRENCLELLISDNGAGFHPNEPGERKTLGLLGMKERAAILNGKFNITSEPRKGTTVLVEVPM